MKNKIIKFCKSVIKFSFKLMYNLFAFIGFLIVFSIFIFSLIDEYEIKHEDTNPECADDGGVWDSEFGICRYDCHTWSKETGCTLILDDELENDVNGYCSTKEGKGLRRCKQAKFELSKRILWHKTLQKQKDNQQPEIHNMNIRSSNETEDK